MKGKESNLELKRKKCLGGGIAEVVKLENTMDSKSIASNGLRVQLPPSALMEKNEKLRPLKRIKNGVKNGVEELKKEFKEKTITLILGGFGLVAALAWNEAIKTLFETLFPKKSELVGKFIYAIIVTIVVVLVSLQFRKITKTSEKE